MGTKKDRNGIDLTEAEDIKKRWQEYTEEIYENIFMTQIAILLFCISGDGLDPCLLYNVTNLCS